MTYALYFALVIIGAIVSKLHSNSKGYLFVIMISLLAIISLRDTTVGADTLSYTEDFARFSQLTFSQMCSLATASNEPLYVFISWLPSICTNSYTIFLFVWALFPVCSLYKTFKVELWDSNDYLIGLIVFFLLGLFAFYVAGIRQTAALSLVLIGSKYLRQLQVNKVHLIIKDKNFYFFLLYIATAYLIHNSAILFLAAIPFLFIRVRWWYIILVVGLFFVGNYVKIEQIVILARFFFEERFANYGTVYDSSQNVSAMIMQLILFFICFSVKDKLIARNPQNNFILNMMFMGFVFQSLSGMMAEMARISFYFSMFAIILVPLAFKEFPASYRKFVYVGFTMVSLFYLFVLTSSNLPEYRSVL